MLIDPCRALNSSSARSRTPPSVPSYGTPHNAGTPPQKVPKSARSSATPRSKYSDLKARSANDWNNDEDEEVGGSEERLDYDDNQDEDEFGLPSLANSRRKTKRAASSLLNDPGGGMSVDKNGLYPLSTGPSTGRARANSADIAEERGSPSYPVAKQSGAKILRPQYKDILRGVYFALKRWSDC